MRTIRSPPIPAIMIVSAASGGMPCRPSDRKNRIFSDTPKRAAFSRAFCSGCSRRSAAVTNGQMPSRSRYMERYP